MGKEINMELIYNKTFGVEIEMTGITRETAARVCATIVGGHVSYAGGAYGKYICKAADGRDWDFVSDASILATGGRDTSCELNTPPLTYNRDMETLQALVRALKSAGAVTGTQYGCGIHIHIGAADHTVNTLKNFLNLLYSNDELVRKALGVTNDRQRWCQPIDKRLIEKLPKIKTMEALKNTWYSTYAPGENMDAHYNNSRYHILNLHRYFSTIGRASNTVEIRAFNATLHAGVIRSYILFVLAMNAQALSSKYILAKKNPIMIAGNEKFAMRTWLNRIGFIGDTFKNPHEHLIKNLVGDAAWRFGKNGNLYQDMPLF